VKLEGMQFETDRFWVRPWREDDVEGWHGIIGSAEVMRYVGGWKISREMRRRWSTSPYAFRGPRASRMRSSNVRLFLIHDTSIGKLLA